jgi:hypothetical protein
MFFHNGSSRIVISNKCEKSCSESIQFQAKRFLPEPAPSKDTKIPRFARNDRREGAEMTENNKRS